MFCFRIHAHKFCSFSEVIFTVAPVSNQHLLHVCRPALDRSSLHRAKPNLIGSSARQAEQEFGIAKAKSSPTPSPHGLHGSGVPTSPLGHFINPALTASQVMTSVGMAALLLLQADVYHAELLQHLGWHDGCNVTLPTRSVISSGPGVSPSLHQPNPETSVLPADQLCHVSWTGGFASARQSLPASPCRRFITHRAMGVRIESQFWE